MQPLLNYSKRQQEQPLNLGNKIFQHDPTVIGVWADDIYQLKERTHWLQWTVPNRFLYNSSLSAAWMDDPAPA